jgi:hypothetical protein
MLNNHKFLIGMLVFIGTAFGLAFMLADHLPLATPPEPTFETALVCFNGQTAVYRGEVDLHFMGEHTRFIEVSTGAEFVTTLPCFAIEPTVAFLERAQAIAAEQERANAPPPTEED